MSNKAIDGGDCSVPDNEPMPDADNIRAIEDLLVGPGATTFRDFEQSVAQFCPFEAIGMVHQEIRHAHFLSYILDPNRSHKFQDRMLKSLLHEIAGQAGDGQGIYQGIAVHCSDLNNAVVHREKSNIDLLIEIPAGSFDKNSRGLVVVVELKINAKEGSDQLERYRELITARYTSDDWDHVFVFLTVDGTSASDHNLEHWIPISLGDLLLRFDEAATQIIPPDEAVDLYRSYAAMMRRHHMRDEELESLAKKVWLKHKMALEALNQYRPDLMGEIHDWMGKNADDLIKRVQDEVGFTLVQSTSEKSRKRAHWFEIAEWNKLAGFCSDNRSWVDSGAVMLLEIRDWGKGRLRASFVLGPGDIEVRKDIYKAVLKRIKSNEISIGNKSEGLPKWKHLSAAYVLNEEPYSKAEENDVSPEELGKTVFEEVVKFLKANLSKYDEIVREACAPVGGRTEGADVSS